MTTRRTLSARRPVTTQKLKIAGRRTVYVSVHDDERPGEVFLRLSGPDMTPELVSCYDKIARLISLALQCGAPLERVGEMLLGTKFEPCGPVVGYARMKFCTSPTDAIARHLLIEFCHRDDLAHAEADDVRETTVRIVKEMID